MREESLDLQPGGSNGFAWRGSDLAQRRDWIVPLADPAEGVAGATDRIKAALAAVGVALVRRAPIAGLDDATAARMLYDFGLEFGCPVSQSEKLDFLGHVTDRGRDIKDHAARGYESSAELPFHNDRCDLLALLCVRQAPIGGETRIVSAVEACRRLAREDSALAAVLFEPVPYDLRDTRGERRWSRMPVFSMCEGVFVARYVRRFIEASQRFEDAPRLTARQIAALDALDAILDEPGMAMDLRLAPGELLLVDNHRILHARSEFTDAPDGAAKRLLLRLWLCWDGSPELPDALAPTYGRTGAGAFRSGVWPEAFPLDGFPSGLREARHRVRELTSGAI